MILLTLLVSGFWNHKKGEKEGDEVPPNIKQTYQQIFMILMLKPVQENVHFLKNKIKL